jgi:predicted ATPase
VRTYDALAAIYTELGYTLVELPCVPVEERARFILSNID